MSDEQRLQVDGKAAVEGQRLAFYLSLLKCE